MGILSYWSLFFSVLSSMTSSRSALKLSSESDSSMILRPRMVDLGISMDFDFADYDKELSDYNSLVSNFSSESALLRPF